MQYYLLFDLGLAFAALLGYRALIAVARRRAPAVSPAPRSRAPARSLPLYDPESSRLRGKPALPAPAPSTDRLRANPHRLINFW